MLPRSARAPEKEPEQKSFRLPSVDVAHLFQVSDIYDMDHNPYGLSLGPDNVAVKCEVAEGEELGRSLLHFMNLDTEWEGFFNTQLFLKAIGEPYKGDIKINPDAWMARQFRSFCTHSKAKNGKTYANISEYVFDKTSPTASAEDIKSFEEKVNAFNPEKETSVDEYPAPTATKAADVQWAE